MDTSLFEFDIDDAGLGAASLTQRSLGDAEELLGAMFDALPVALLIHTEQGILFSNKEACALLGSEKSRLTGQHFVDFIGPEDGPDVHAALRRAFSHDGTSERECVVQSATGESRLASVVMGRLPWPGTPVAQVLFRDITDQKRAEASLRQLTITDELTGAYNRRHVLYEASLYVDQYATSGLPLSAAIIDIDHFKNVNDTHGHAVGDAALQHLAKLAEGFLPLVRDADSAIFARIGGEEFVMLLPGIDQRRAEDIAERFRAVVERSKVRVGDTSIRFTVSIGVAAYAAEDKGFEDLLRRADAALYRAKNEGRNRVVGADSPC